jgi:Tfp pilus assembly protein PilF
MRKELDNAMDFFENALKISPGSPDILRDLARLHLITGNIAAAHRYISQARQLPDDNQKTEKLYLRIRYCSFLHKIRTWLSATREKSSFSAKKL